MQKLSLKKSLTALAVALFFFATAGLTAFAAEPVKATDKKFEVTLQTPFSAPPTPKCEKETESKAETKAVDGTTVYWVCRKGSILWQQVIGGDDGQEILTNYAGMIYKFLAGFIGVVSVLMVVVGGIQIMTAGANQNGVKSGRDRILAALVGLAILFSASLILYTINPTFFVNG
ncbi:MAG: hypothetical protein V2A63_04350 [Patescibacteria group bacterium]